MCLERSRGAARRKGEGRRLGRWSRALRALQGLGVLLVVTRESLQGFELRVISGCCVENRWWLGAG